MADPDSTESLKIQTSDGFQLVAQLRSPADPIITVAICHPHPLYGGDMYSNVVAALFDHLAGQGAACIRFNFRGSGGSEGQHDEGGAERLDVTAALDALDSRWPDLPTILAGYSFGADVSLAVDDERIDAWFAVAPPLRVVPTAEMMAGPDPREKVIVTGSVDDFRPPEQVTGIVDSWQNTSLTVAEGANHFFASGLGTVRDTAAELLSRLTAAS
ncbi:MAG: alpha/beta hydrolase [Acidimicrobiales bacterium]